MILTYEQVTELLPAYAVGTLEGEEKSAVEEYLQNQDALLKRLARAESATALMAQATAPVAIATGAKERLMKRVQAGLPDRTPNELRRHTSETTSGGSPHANPEPANPRSQRKRQMQAQSAPVQARARAKANPRAVIAPSSRRADRAAARRNIGHPAQVGQHGAGAPTRLTPADLFPQERRRRQSFFRTRALLNAATIAALVTLAFVGLVNYDIDQDLRRTAAELQSARLEMSHMQSLIVELNGANATLVDQYSRFIEEQERLAAANADVKAENEEIVAQQSELTSEIDSLVAENRMLAIERANLFEEKTRLDSRLATEDQRLTLISTATQALVMAGTEEAPASHATFFQRQMEGALVVQGLDALGQDETYQIWLLTEDGNQISAGLFQVDQTQRPTWTDLTLPSNLPDYTSIGITVEPASGSDAPTGPVVLESEGASDLRPATG